MEAGLRHMSSGSPINTGNIHMSNDPVAKKSLGQHWLNDRATLEYICNVGEVAQDDVVLEIGPGTGTLTEVLLSAGAKVTAVEFDKWLATGLINKFSNRSFNLIQGDILEFDLTALPPGYKVIANIPYYLTSNLIRVLSESPNQASKVVLLVQHEVAQRVAARPGDMSLLSVSAQYYWEVELGDVVPAKLFTPPPKIDSQVIIMNRRSAPLFAGVDEKAFFQVVKAGYSSRRKTLLNSLAGGLRRDKADIQTMLDEADIISTRRAQTLALGDWHRLYEVYCDKQLK